MQNAIKISNLTKEYKGFKLNNIDLTLPSGCIMGFIGENGAGKSTTIKLILDLISRDAGEISVLNGDLRTNPALKEHIGVVMDDSGFPVNLSAKDIRLIMKNCYKTWNNTAFNNYLAKFNLGETKRIKDYSRGMKMKLAIAVALSHDSQLLILDEATSGLDPIVRDEILDVFLEFIQEENHSILISSHIISDLEKICDYITFIHKGEIMFSESKDELLNKYAIIKCSEAQYAQLNKSDVIGVRKSTFGVEALMLKNKISKSLLTDKASIEDIMLFFVKEGK